MLELRPSSWSLVEVHLFTPHSYVMISFAQGTASSLDLESRVRPSATTSNGGRSSPVPHTLPAGVTCCQCEEVGASEGCYSGGETDQYDCLTRAWAQVAIGSRCFSSCCNIFSSRYPSLPSDPTLSSPKVHLDMDFVTAPDDFVGLAPMSLLCERLWSVVNPGVGTLDDPSSGTFMGGGAWTERTTSEIRWYFKEFVSELLQVRRANS